MESNFYNLGWGNYVGHLSDGETIVDITFGFINKFYCGMSNLMLFFRIIDVKKYVDLIHKY